MAWIGLLVSAVGAISEGQSAKKAGEESAVDIAKRKVRGEAAALDEEASYRDREKRLLATGRVIGAAQGTTDEGSPLLIASDLASEIEEQAMKIKHGGELVGRRMSEQASLSLRQGRRAEGAAAVRAGGSLLKGAGSYYGTSGGSA